MEDSLSGGVEFYTSPLSNLIIIQAAKWLLEIINFCCRVMGSFNWGNSLDTIVSWGDGVFLVAGDTATDSRIDLSVVSAPAAQTYYASRRQLTGLAVLGRWAWKACTTGVLVITRDARTEVVGIRACHPMEGRIAGSAGRGGAAGRATIRTRVWCWIWIGVWIGIWIRIRVWSISHDIEQAIVNHLVSIDTWTWSNNDCWRSIVDWRAGDYIVWLCAGIAAHCNDSK